MYKVIQFLVKNCSIFQGYLSNSDLFLTMSKIGTGIFRHICLQVNCLNTISTLLQLLYRLNQQNL